MVTTWLLLLTGLLRVPLPLELVSGLLGALIGGGAALWAQMLSNRAANREAIRRDKEKLISQLWASCDALWQVTKSLDSTIHNFQASHAAGHHDIIPEIDEQRRSEIVEKRKAETDARILTAQFRLRHPEMATAAESLLEASKSYKFDGRQQYEERRQNALDMYEATARRILAADKRLWE